MNWKSVVVLVVLASALGGFFYYDTYWLTPAREKAESAKGRLWTVEPKDVEAVTIKRSGDTIRLKRAQGGDWEMLEPVQARGDRATIDDVVTGLVTVRVDREIDPNPAKPDDFGLEPAAAEVRLAIKGRTDPLTLQVGAKSPTGAWVYAREGQKPAVMTVSELVGRDTSRPVADFRDKTVIVFDRKGVTAVDLDVGGERIALQTDEANKWRIVTPSPFRADADLIGGFLDKLSAAKVKEFVADSPASLGPYGLDRPSAVTIWTGKDKERSSRALRFGRVDAEKKGVYVARAGEAGVMLAPEDLWEAFPKTVAALRDKVAVTYAPDKVSRVEVASIRGRVGIEREGTDWKITEPERLRADSGAVNALLWSIRDLRASAFLADAPSEIPRFLDKPDVTVKIWEEGAKEPKTVLVKSSPLLRGGRPAAVLAVEGQGPVMLVDGKAVVDLSKTEADLRDRSVFPAFDMGAVKRARVTAAGKPLVVERSGQNDWKTLEPARGPAKGTKVTDLLLALKSLRWTEIVSPKGDDAGRYGLDQPELEVSLYTADGGELGTLQVGTQAGELTYVRLKGGPTIYAVESKLVGDLRKVPSEIPG
jgi:Domain of unknown function (DUF4340)